MNSGRYAYSHIAPLPVATCLTEVATHTVAPLRLVRQCLPFPPPTGVSTKSTFTLTTSCLVSNAHLLVYLFHDYPAARWQPERARSGDFDCAALLDVQSSADLSGGGLGASDCGREGPLGRFPQREVAFVRDHRGSTR